MTWQVHITYEALIIIQTGKITLYESIALVSLYFAYVLCVVVGNRIYVSEVR